MWCAINPGKILVMMCMLGSGLWTIKLDIHVMFHDKLNYEWHETECFNFCKCNMTQKNLKIFMWDYEPAISVWLKFHDIWITVKCIMKFPCENMW